MNITKFINSRDIADYFDKHFNEYDHSDYPVGYAWLIWQSEKQSLSEKHKAWQDLIENTPDISVADQSLHSLLRNYMSIENDLLDSLLRDEPDTVFSYVVRKKDHQFGGFGYETNWQEFKTLEECKDAFLNEEHSDNPPLGVLVTKSILSKDTNGVNVMFSHDMKTVLRVEPKNIEGTSFESMSDIFAGIHYDFPTPFRCGDIVHSTTVFGSSSRIDSKPFCFKRTSVNNGMYAEGLVAFAGGMVKSEQFSNYMSLEYYRGDLSEEDSVLKHIRQYYYDEIELENLLNIYHLLSSKEELRKVSDYCSRFTE